MKRGEFTVALGVTASHATITHVARCPEVDPVGCGDMPLPDHVHDVELTFAKASIAGTIGIGWDLAAYLEIPVDVKRRRRDYQTLNGAPFDPPYGDLHHRNDTLWGLGDPTLAVEWNKNLGRTFRIGARAGVRIPIGDTTENPDPLAAQSLDHEHMQIGSGTFDPVLALSGSWIRGKWGVFGRFGARLPAYESSAGYRGGRQLDLVLGPGFRFSDRLLAFAQLGVSQSGEERWDGERNEVSKRDVARVVLGGNIGVGSGLRVGPVVQIELANTAVGGEYNQPIIGTLTLTYGNQRRAEPL